VPRRRPVERVEVTVHKPSAPIALEFADVSVTWCGRDAVLSIGSNLGDGSPTCASRSRCSRRSRVGRLETAPVGGTAQDDYLNAVLLCDLDATGAWQRAQAAERASGRERTVRWGPRTLDVDVVWAPPPVPDGLLVPHPRAHERAFVLAPWLEVDPAAELPGAGPVRDLLAALGTDGVTRRADLVL
jgi:2-amino-4-hydroxy-6-hydroxymethyldihydropteridine diphosphokinase